MFFDIQNDRTIIYDPSDLAELTLKLTAWLEKLKDELKIIMPELLTGTSRHERMRLVAAAVNVSEAPYGIFDLMQMANEHIFIAGQNLGFLHQTEKNKRTFIEHLKIFLDRSSNSQVDIMICNENCEHAIKTWEYATNVKEYIDHLKRAVDFFKNIKKLIGDENRHRVMIRQFDFVPTSAFFIDPDTESGLGVLIPNVFQGINNARPCFVFSERENKNILHQYWSVYYHWFTAKPSNEL